MPAAAPPTSTRSKAFSTFSPNKLHGPPSLPTSFCLPKSSVSTQDFLIFLTEQQISSLFTSSPTTTATTTSQFGHSYSTRTSKISCYCHRIDNHCTTVTGTGTTGSPQGSTSGQHIIHDNRVCHCQPHTSLKIWRFGQAVLSSSLGFNMRYYPSVPCSIASHHHFFTRAFPYPHFSTFFPPSFHLSTLDLAHPRLEDSMDLRGALSGPLCFREGAST